MTATQDGDSAREQPGQQAPIEDVVRLEGALHLLRFSLDRFIRAGFKPAPEYLRELLDRVTEDPGEPCDRGQQYARAEKAEAAIARALATLAPVAEAPLSHGYDNSEAAVREFACDVLATLHGRETGE